MLCKVIIVRLRSVLTEHDKTVLRNTGVTLHETDVTLPQNVTKYKLISGNTVVYNLENCKKIICKY